MEKLKSAQKALQSFEKVLDLEFSDIVRDSSIQRFEFTFEICWKATKEFLQHEHGVDVNSPKQAFKTAFKVTLIKEDECMTLCNLCDLRNLTSHTYIEAVADDIYAKRKECFNALKELILKISRFASE